MFKIRFLSIVLLFSFALLLVKNVSVQAQSAAQGAPNILARWFMDETTGTTITDSSGNGRHGTLNGEVIWNSGLFGNALNFDNSDEFVSLPHNFEMSSGTITAWVKSPYPGMDQVIFAEGLSSANDGPYLMLTIHDQRAGLYQKSGSQFAHVYGHTPITDGNWHLMSWTFDGTPGGLTIYVDGIPQILTAEPNSDVENIFWFDGCAGDLYTLGQLRRANGHQFGQFYGDLDEITLYDRVLSAREIRLQHQFGSGLLARWDMNTNSLPLVADRTGNSFDGLGSYLAWGQDGTHKFLDFQMGGYVDIAQPIETPFGSTISAYVQLEGPENGYQVIFSEGYTEASDFPYLMLLTYQNRIALYEKSGIDNDNLCYGATPLNDGAWHLLTWTHGEDTGSLQTYVDGQPETMICSSGSLSQTYWFDQINGNLYTIGLLRRDPMHSFGPWVGRMDEVTLYGRVLTAAEVQAAYQEISLRRFELYLPALARTLYLP